MRNPFPIFTHTLRRFAAMESAISSDVVNRAVVARAEIDFALARHAMVSVLLDANLPERTSMRTTTPEAFSTTFFLIAQPATAYA